MKYDFRTRWEYRQVHVRECKPERLAEWGQEGWELVAVDASTAWFKRRLLAPPSEVWAARRLYEESQAAGDPRDGEDATSG